jgi:hypothetical protein
LVILPEQQMNDNVYDGVSFNGNAFIDFFSISKDENFVIREELAV